MNVDEAACFLGLTIIFPCAWVENLSWNCAVWSSYRGEFDIVDRVYLVLGNSVKTDNLEVLTAFVVGIFLPTKMQIWKFFKESRD